MSYLKCTSIWIFGLILMFTVGCTKKEVLLETGERFVQETICLTEMEPETVLQNKESKALIYVYVCGQVAAPGVYEMETGDRIYQALDKAGGVLPEGNLSWLNLASVVSDGQKIYVPSNDETAARTLDESGGTDSGYVGLTGDLDASSQRVNINQATKEQLMTLPGIGQSKAEAILKYRQEYGGFESLEELMKVPGIKEGTYSQIKDRIAIN